MYSAPPTRRGMGQEIPVRLPQVTLNQWITTESDCFSSRLFLSTSLIPVIHIEWLFFCPFLYSCSLSPRVDSGRQKFDIQGLHINSLDSCIREAKIIK